MLDFLSDAFSKHYTVLKATDGQKGLELAENNIPEIIITDVMMPVMGGIEFCEKIKQNVKTSHIPVIMLTAKDTVEQQIVGINSGADAYLSKPFQLKHLQAHVTNLLDSRKKIQQSWPKP